MDITEVVSKIASPDFVASGSDVLLLIAKIGVIIFLLAYIVFAIIVVRQVVLMTDTLNVAFGKFVVILSYFHLIIAVGVLLIALIVL